MFRKEHPKPQFMREHWLNLNGEWQFELDLSNSGEPRGLAEPDAEYSKKIQVPFCPESKLSGIEMKDFMAAVWYKRSFVLKKEQLSGRVRLHFGAVDYEATVYINGEKCGTHRGGYVSFFLDITKYVREGENILCVHATDDTRSRLVPSGKQSKWYEPLSPCYYTRSTGIWQTVWLEFLPETHIEKVHYATDIHNATLQLTAELCGEGTLTAEAFYEGRSVGYAEAISYGGQTRLLISLSEKHLWEVGAGRLYDLVLIYGEDRVKSYFGMRQVRIEGNRFLINEKPVFQRLVLDQGYYPDGIYTAPSDAELEADVDRSIAMGFNGARLHEKIFEERFLYHCDRKGYIVWGEYPNWGLDLSYADSICSILPEWLEEVGRDINHPSIIGWCPFNETELQEKRRQLDPLLSLVYRATKVADPDRPCIDSSGFFHVETDIYDLHDYEQNPVVFAENYKELGRTNLFSFPSAHPKRQQYDGKKPFFVSEYGGIRWTEDENGWGYGNAPQSPEAFLERLEGLTKVLLRNPLMFGFCYTQLTDVEREQNGLYTYDRKAKFDPAVIHKIFSGKAAYEE